eukprot:6192989-Pleurochrysis_carterae.AAC.1
MTTVVSKQVSAYPRSASVQRYCTRTCPARSAGGMAMRMNLALSGRGRNKRPRPPPQAPPAPQTMQLAVLAAGLALIAAASWKLRRRKQSRSEVEEGAAHALGCKPYRPLAAWWDNPGHRTGENSKACRAGECTRFMTKAYVRRIHYDLLALLRYQHGLGLLPSFSIAHVDISDHRLEPPVRFDRFEAIGAIPASHCALHRHVHGMSRPMGSKRERGALLLVALPDASAGALLSRLPWLPHHLRPPLRRAAGPDARTACPLHGRHQAGHKHRRCKGASREAIQRRGVIMSPAPPPQQQILLILASSISIA